MTDHAQFINDQYESGAAQEKASTSKQERMARVIQDLLGQAEMASKRGDEAARDDAIAKASALQLKYAVDDAMLATGAQDKDQLTEADFCTESNTPLIKAKRQMINSIAKLNRGHAVMMGDWKEKRTGGRRWDKRAKVRVYAHTSDLAFITMLYNSLIIQLQTMMANDEAKELHFRQGAPAWRVSYAYGWVARVHERMHEAKERNESEAEVGQPGTALVLRDRTAIVKAHIAGLFGQLKSVGYRVDDNSAEGRAAGRQAAERADLGGKKIGRTNTRRLEA